jgi:hypothetical protein
VKVTFVGYVEYQPSFFRGEFLISGHDWLPDNTQVSADTLRALKIEILPYPTYYEWRREIFKRRLSNVELLKELWP